MSTDKFEYPPGARIPGTNYRVIRAIGAGGMGIVYEVEDVSIEKRYVLKTIQARLAGRDDAVERFIREAKALAKLDHKNIVQVFTAGITGDAMALRYFVMEKLSGHSLRTVLDNKQRLDFEAACRTTIELMGALDKAHEHGIIHRDIKPENIFLHRDSNGVTTLKLLDFGIMTSADARTVDRKGFVGTVRYAAPEQIQGENVTPSSDLYAATLVLYECVAGRGPFDEIVDFNQLVAAHMTRPPPRLSVFRPDVPRALEDLVMRGLAKDPATRPPDAFSYAAELNRIRRAIQEGGLPSPTAISTAHDLLADQAESRGTEAGSTARDAGPPSPALTGAKTPHLDMSPRDAATRAEGQLAGATTPATERRAPAMDPLLGGATVAAEVPMMTLGPEALPAAPAPNAARPSGDARPLAAPIDRNAPTATHVPDLARPGAGGDTLHMSPVEQQNLRPFVEGAVQKTTRMEPVPQAFGATTEPPELRVTSANTSQSIGDALPMRGGSANRMAWIGVAVLALVALAGAAVFLVVRVPRSNVASSAPSAPPQVIASALATSSASAGAPEPSPSIASAPSSSVAPFEPTTLAAAPSASTTSVAAPSPAPRHTAHHSDGDLLETHRTSSAATTSSPTTAAPRATASTRRMPGSGL